MDSILRFLINPSPHFVLLFIGTIAGLFLLIFLQAQRKIPAEAGRTPIYSTIGGGSIGWLNYRGPFVGLRFYEDFLVIRALQTVVLPYAEIESVEVKKWLGLTADRVQITHRSLHAPETIILGVSNPERIKEMIDQRRLGQVQKSEPGRATTDKQTTESLNALRTFLCETQCPLWLSGKSLARNCR